MDLNSAHKLAVSRQQYLKENPDLLATEQWRNYSQERLNSLGERIGAISGGTGVFDCQFVSPQGNEISLFIQVAITASSENPQGTTTSRIVVLWNDLTDEQTSRVPLAVELIDQDKLARGMEGNIDYDFTRVEESVLAAERAYEQMLGPDTPSRLGSFLIEQIVQVD